MKQIIIRDKVTKNMERELGNHICYKRIGKWINAKITSVWSFWKDIGPPPYDCLYLHTIIYMFPIVIF